MNKPTVFPSRLLICWVTAVGMLSAACGSSNQDAPLRSPTLDYRPPPPVTADGKVVGADGVPPQDRLEEGPAAGTKAGLAPGWEAGEEGLRYDPKQRVGGEVDRKNEHSSKPEVAH
jgi:hypothetical protein